MKLCVILPVYNAERYLNECLDSLLNQTFSNFCILAVNDASTDNSPAILDEYAKKDSRVNVFHFEKNKGEAQAANFAINIANQLGADYIARMDYDDICLPERFEKQIEYLDEHPEIDILGCNIVSLNSDHSVNTTNLPSSDDLIKANFLIASANILNPTSMWRVSSIAPLKIQNNNFKAPDYAMWVECALNNKKFANLNEHLLIYRIHPNQVSKQKGEIAKSVDITLSKWLDRIFPTLSDIDKQLICKICNSSRPSFTIHTSELLQLEKIIPQVTQTASVVGENREEMKWILEYKLASLQKQISS